MENGDLIVVDATHYKKKLLNRYKDLCGVFRYRCFTVDFTHLSLEECYKNNSKRPAWKQVPEPVIATYYYTAISKSEQPATWTKVLKPSELDKALQWRITDTSQWKKIHFIGDLQVLLVIAINL